MLARYVCMCVRGYFALSTDDGSSLTTPSTPQYQAELVVARVPGLKGLPDNWLKGLSLLTLLGPR